MTEPTYRVHKMHTGMAIQGDELEKTLNAMSGDIVAVIPNIMQFPFARVNYLLVVERVPERWPTG